MGIKRIFQASRELAPQCISAPFPLSALRGLRVAIDATLVTQRLHFTEDPHVSRHLIGFYRLIRSLRQVGVQPIMVFDHPHKRLALKEREQEKRREKRNLDIIRSKLEAERRQRLQGLSQSLKDIQALSSDERLEAGAILQRWNASKAQGQRVYASEQDLDEDLIAFLSEKQARLAPLEQHDWWHEIHEIVQSDPRPLLPYVDTLPAEPEPPLEDDAPSVSTSNEPWIQTIDVEEESLSRPHTIAYKINMYQTQLLASYRRSEHNHSQTQKKLAEGEGHVYEHITRQLLEEQKVATPLAQVQADRAMMQALDTLQVDAQKIQSATTDELIKSDTPALPTPPSPEFEPLSPSLSSLEETNATLSKTYDRGTMSLPASVYQDCADLSTLMAVPVFWTGDGTREGGGRIHEAEAYAASLVQAGYADLVASEDSDVLLYDAVLLRGLLGGVKANGKPTLDKRVEIVGSTRLRQGLFPYEDLSQLHTQLTAQKQARLAALAEEKEQKRLRSRSANKTQEVSELPTSPDPVLDPNLSPEHYDRMTRDMMLEYALLCGTDFNQTIPFVGPKIGHRLLKQYGSISAILENMSSKYQPPGGLSVKEYEVHLRNARSVFTNPPAVKAAARSVFKATGPSAPTVATPISEEELFTLVSQHDTAETEVEALQPSAVAYDEEAVINYLHVRGVTRFSLWDRHSKPNTQDGRGDIDSEPRNTPDSSDAAAAAQLLSSDYFGQRRHSDGISGVACWEPSADTFANVKRETNLDTTS